MLVRTHEHCPEKERRLGRRRAGTVCTQLDREDDVKKLKMKLDDLRVDSFATALQSTDRRGTVRANLNASFSQCYGVSGGSSCDFDTFTDDQTNACYNESMNCP
jgi:hypothetical protein